MMKTITFFATLMQLAKEEADARSSGDPVRLAEAERKHEEYRQLCLNADEIIMGGFR
jgi:hypothetical protein